VLRPGPRSALDARTGAIRWRHRFGTGAVNTVVPLDAGRVLVTDLDGRVAVIEARDPGR